MGSFDRGGRGGFSSGGRSSFGRGGPRRDFAPRGGSSFGDRGDRPMFKTVCSNCGKECEVPFRPTNGKPVYCSDCFEKMGRGRSDSPRPERSEFRPQPVSNQNSAQLEAISAKLDKIIKLLEPKNVEAVMPDIVVEEVKKPSKKKTKSSK